MDTDAMLRLIDRVAADPATRDTARLELLRLADAEPAVAAGAAAGPLAADAWNGRARPAFLYVMYALLLWSIPVGMVAAVRPALADAITRGMTGYLAGIPEPLYALFATGYVGYTVARSWGKAKGVER